MVLSLEHRIYRNVLDVQGYANRVKKRMEDALFESRDMVLDRLERMGPDSDFTRWHQRTILQEIDATLLVYGEQQKALLTTAQREVIQEEFDSVSKALIHEARVVDEFVQPTLSTARMKAILSKPIGVAGGKRMLETWIKSGNNRLKGELRRSLAASIEIGESIKQTSRRLRERFGLGRRSATVLTRTTLLGAGTYARNEVYRECRKLITSFTYMATLDSRVCLMCAPDDGVTAEQQKNLPGCPRHPQCRCVQVANTRFSDDPLRRPAVYEEEQHVTHHRDGSTSSRWKKVEKKMVPADVRFENFFKSQPAKWKREYLGKDRYELFRQHNLSLDDLRAAGTNRILNLNQLRASLRN